MHPNIKFTKEKQINHSIAFLDVFISGINDQNLTLQTYHKLTYTGLLLNLKSFTTFSYKISLIKFVIHRPFKICNNSNSFHNDIENIKSNLIKNASPLLLNCRMFLKKTFYQFAKDCSAINKRNKELQHLSKGLSVIENFLSTQLFTTDFYILTKSITLYNKKSLKKSLHSAKEVIFTAEGSQLTYIHI